MLYIKENSRELIEEYMDDITYLEEQLKEVSRTKDLTNELLKLKQYMDGKDDVNRLESIIDVVEYQSLNKVENGIIKHFKSSSQPVFLFEALSLEDLDTNIQMTIDALTNRIMAILKRSR